MRGCRQRGRSGAIWTERRDAGPRGERQAPRSAPDPPAGEQTQGTPERIAGITGPLEGCDVVVHTLPLNEMPDVFMGASASRGASVQLLPGLGRDLLGADGGAEPRGAAADDDDVELHALPLDLSSKPDVRPSLLCHKE